MKKLKDIQIGNDGYEISLTKLVDKSIKDIRGYISTEYDAIFKLTRVEFEDGTFMSFEGEHDFPYLTNLDKQPNFDSDTLESLAEEQEQEDATN